ncbi:MAG: hypothetical protein Q4D90_01000 [bacterium]|nr:hypothetical protein [bacterium]
MRTNRWKKGTLLFLGLWGIASVGVFESQAAEASGPQLAIEQQQASRESQEQQRQEEIQREQAVNGWNEGTKGWFYQGTDGVILTNTMTPDAYYVDENGIWKQEVLTLLNLEVTAPSRFVKASAMEDWEPLLAGLGYLREEIERVMPENRSFHVYSDSIVYQSISGKTESDLLSLEKGKNGEGYFLRVSCDLGKGGQTLSTAADYDYQVFRFLCAQISSTPSRLAAAIYESWQGGNGYGLEREKEKAVGDAQIKYYAENGCGVYSIVPR